MKRLFFCILSLLALTSMVEAKGGGGGCFPAGTLIRTPTGLVPIESLKVGDSILEYVDFNSAPVEGKILKTFKLEDQLFTLHTLDGNLTTTAEHPLAVWGGNFKPASTITTADRLVYLRPDGFLVSSPVWFVGASTTRTTVYNIEVTENHAFFASNFAVHNKGGGGGGGGHAGGGGGHVSGSGGGHVSVASVHGFGEAHVMVGGSSRTVRTMSYTSYRPSFGVYRAPSSFILYQETANFLDSVFPMVFNNYGAYYQSQGNDFSKADKSFHTTIKFDDGKKFELYSEIPFDDYNIDQVTDTFTFLVKGIPYNFSNPTPWKGMLTTNWETIYVNFQGEAVVVKAEDGSGGDILLVIFLAFLAVVVLVLLVGLLVQALG